jgi:hypothetical protein
MMLAPARQHVLRNIQQVENARDHEIDRSSMVCGW